LKKNNLLLYHLPLLAYAIVIIVLSSLSHLKTPEIRFLAFDKIAHFFEYALLAFLTVRSFSHISQNISKNKAYLLTALFIIIFALFDEYFVQTLSRRVSSMYDLMADVVGAYILMLSMWFFQKIRDKKEQI